jgi:hypothetical protein
MSVPPTLVHKCHFMNLCTETVVVFLSSTHKQINKHHIPKEEMQQLALLYVLYLYTRSRNVRIVIISVLYPKEMRKGDGS